MRVSGDGGVPAFLTTPFSAAASTERDAAEPALLGGVVLGISKKLRGEAPALQRIARANGARAPKDDCDPPANRNPERVSPSSAVQ